MSMFSHRDDREGELVRRVSHELRTPLNAIIGFAQLLEADSLSASQLESLEQIMLGAQHLLELTGQLLEISSAESERHRAATVPVEVGTLARRAVALCGPLAAQQGLDLRVACGSEEHWAICEPRGLTQVLLNLISNAVRYNRPGGSIEIGLQSGAGVFRLEVSDTGIGIDPDQLGRLFRPFERLDAAERGIEGTGLGLALSRSLIESMGGAIEVDTEPGVGSTFSVRLRSVPAPRRAADDSLVALLATR